MFNIGGIEFNVKTNLKDLGKALKLNAKQFEILEKSTKVVSASMVKMTKAGEKLSKSFKGVSETSKVLQSSLTKVVAASGKFAAVAGGPLLLALSGLEVALGGVVKNLGINFVQASNRALEVGLEFEELNFGLKAAVDAYSRATGDASIHVDALRASMNKLQKATGVSSGEIQQAQLIMLEMSRSTGLTNTQMETLIERAADFSIVANQDFLSVVLAIDNAFVGLPQRLSNMGINVTKAALAMEGGSKGAAVYKKIIESTDFAVGKVAESFDTTLFGALNRSSAAWENFDRAVGEATVSFRSGIKRELVSLSAVFAEMLTPFAQVIALMQTFGGPTLVVIGQVIQLTSVITLVVAAVQGFKFVLASGAVPILNKFATSVKGTAGALVDYGIAQGVVSASIKTMTARQIVWNTVMLFTSEILSSLRLVLIGLVRVLGPLALAIGALVLAWKVYKETLGKTREEILQTAEITRIQIKTQEKALETFDKFKNTVIATRKEQIEFNKAVKVLNDILPNSIELQKNENTVLAEHTDLLRKDLAIKQSLKQVSDIQVREELQAAEEEKIALEEEIKKNKETLLKKTQRFVRTADTRRTFLSLRDFALGTQSFFVDRDKKELEDNQLKLQEVKAEIAKAKVILGISTDTALKGESQSLKQILLLKDQEIRRLEQEISLKRELVAIDEASASLKVKLTDTDSFTADLARIKQQRENLNAEQKLITARNTTERAKLTAIKTDLEGKTTVTGGAESPQFQKDKKALDEVEEALKAFDKAVANGKNVFAGQKKLFDSQEALVRKNLAKTLSDVFTKTANEAKNAFSGVLTTTEAQLREFDERTTQTLQKLRKEREDLLKELPQEKALQNKIKGQEEKLAALKQAVVSQANLSPEADINLNIQIQERDVKKKTELITRQKAFIKESRKSVQETEGQIATVVLGLQNLIADGANKDHPSIVAAQKRVEEVKKDVLAVKKDIKETEIAQKENEKNRAFSKSKIVGFKNNIDARAKTRERLKTEGPILAEQIENDKKRLETENKAVTKIQVELDKKHDAFQARRAVERQKLLLQLQAGTQAKLLSQSRLAADIEIQELERQQEARERIVRAGGAKFDDLVKTRETKLRRVTLEKEQLTAELGEVQRKINNTNFDLSELQRQAIGSNPASGQDSSAGEIKELEQRRNALVLTKKQLKEGLTALKTEQTQIQSAFMKFFEQTRKDEAIFQATLQRDAVLVANFVDKVTDDQSKESIFQRLAREIDVAQLVLANLEVEQAKLNAKKDNLAVSSRTALKDVTKPSEKEIITEKINEDQVLGAARVTAQKKVVKELLAVQSQFPQQRVIAEKEADLQILVNRRTSRKEILKAEASLLQDRATLLEESADGDKSKVKEAEVLRQEADKKLLEATGGIFDGLKEGLIEFSDSASTTFELTRDLTIQTAQAMQQAFQTFFFDVFTSNVSSLKDTMRSLLLFAQQVIAQVLAQQAATGLIKVLGFGAAAGSATPVSSMNGGLIRSRNFMGGGAVIGNQPGIFGDNVPANLADGEFVLKQQAVKRLGLRNVQLLNEGVNMMPRIITGSTREKDQTVTIVNMVDPNEVSRFIQRNPKAITNVVSSEILRNGSLRTTIRR